VKEGYCLIEEVCHQKGTTEVCGRCSPGLSQTQWTPLNGVTCDDKNLCTKGDECKDGVCVGQSYSCSDSLACTVDSCDGLGGCNQYLDPNFCQIEKTCFKHQQTDPTACLICDVSISQQNWHVRTNVCTIDGHCHEAGAKDPTGCFACDPQHAADAWTFQPGRCLISGVCVSKGSFHPSGCASCEPSQSSALWTPIGGATSTVSAFTAGLDGYLVSPAVIGVGWQTSVARHTSPPASLYYGDPSTGSYDNGKHNSGTAAAPAFKLPQGQKAWLSFQLYMDTEQTSNFDVLEVRANKAVVWSKASQMTSSDYQKWIQVTLDLGPLAGQTVKLEFAFDTKDHQNNQSEGVYIDDVTLLTWCGNAP
jgi:hypothetical protein